MPGPQGVTGAPTMSLGKLSPVSWVSSAQGKRRLTADMISPPLGDFRHTMHVGRGGDVFGDTSFLSNHGGGSSSGGSHRSPRSYLAKKLQQVRRAGATPRRVASPPSASPAPPAVSPIIKNAISLPQLNQATYDSLVVGKISFDSSPASPKDGHSSYGLDSGFCTITRLPRQDKPRERDRESTFPSEPELRRSDSLLSFRLDLDLGPSLLSELLGVMSLSEASAVETPGQASATNPPTHGHCPNGVTAGLGAVAETSTRPSGECPLIPVPTDKAPSRPWGVGSGDSRHPTQTDAGHELAGALPQARASWESLDEEWGAPRVGGRAPVPSAVQAHTFAFADTEEDDEVKV
ncbi:cdc42 effector protein 1 [Erinaceus europaeus]|uniref:Cdc42 effector protein 1 n=1 Tax=Erinaceus europaeus TaxID=9365 RepID=A0ABM3X7W6_ERIEU|nr:cdc42 effector protein 1 [Erinaceus europaeus]